MSSVPVETGGIRCQDPDAPRDPAAGARPEWPPCPHHREEGERPTGHSGSRIPTGQGSSATPHGGPPSTPPPEPRADGPAPPAPQPPHRATGPAPRAHREPSPPSRRPARPGPRLAAASRDVAPSREGASGTPLPSSAVNFRPRGRDGAGKGSDALGRTGRACALRWVCSGRGAGLPRLTRDNRGATVLVAFPPAPRWALAVSRLLGPRGNGTFCRLCPPKG